MGVTVERDSVCMGDDVYSPNTMALPISGDMNISQFLKQNANYAGILKGN